MPNGIVNGSWNIFDGYPLATDATDLIFGGKCGVVFKDIQIDTMTSRDAEIVDYYEQTTTVISSVNPLIIILEGHQMIEDASHEVPTHTGNMGTTPDRLQLTFTKTKGKKGYIPISLEDLKEWHYNGRELPKRCYTMMFDDFEFNNFFEIKKTGQHLRGLMLSRIFVLTQIDQTLLNITVKTITPEKAILIGKNAGFDFVTHTRNHRNITKFKVSDYEEEWLQDVYSGDEFGVNPNIIVYPFGDYNLYNMNTLKWWL